MKYIVTHMSPDLDAITSCWLIQRFLPGWNESKIKFVRAGERLEGFTSTTNVVEMSGQDEVIHVDTGLGALDHHQTSSTDLSASSLTWEYVSSQWIKANPEMVKHDKWKYRKEAIERLVKVVVDVDHFKEVFWDNPDADYHDFSLVNILDGLKAEKPGKDKFFIEFGYECLDALLHEMENKIWAEYEIKNKGVLFDTRFGKGIGLETINDTVVKLAQKMGYAVVIRKDPRKGYVRIKAKPDQHDSSKGVDFTNVCEELKKLDPQASWYLHILKKMLLNGSSKNPSVKPTKLGLNDIIEVVKKV
ncbi:hypothetical protein M1349_04825 [Patescibacteria group bacterium]|nr:hypothetical protein [Patescibacteria group bacterium]